MEVQASDFLAKTKPVLKKLLDRLLKIYPYASILAVDAASVSYGASRQITSMGEDDLLTSRGFVVKVYDGQSYGEYSFDRISEDTIGDIVKGVARVAVLRHASGGLPANTYPMLADEPCVFSGSTEYEIGPDEVGDEEILRRLTALKEDGLAQSEKVIDAIVRLNYQKYSKLFLSPNRDMEQNVMWTNGTLSVMVQKGQQIRYSYRGFSGLGGLELIDGMRAQIPAVAKNALDLLDAEPMTPGEYDCICTPPVTGMIAHEAFGHGVEMDMFVKDRALAKSCVGQYVAAPILTMHDGATLESRRETASYFFDDEGVLSTDTVVIKDGILQTGISDAQSAMALGTKPTGNGRRESFRRKAYTRMTNTWFEGGKDRLEDMIASISYGFLLDDPASGMEDPKNWGIQMMVNIAREIKDGKLTGRIFSPIVLTGYVPDLLKSITMMTAEPELCGTGFCGKGYKEWVKVSDGGPYIKARIRLG